MNLYTNAFTTQNALKKAEPSTNRTLTNPQIGSKISASIGKDLGGGRYILNLGGSETMYVESTENFRENQQIDLEVRANSNGRVELKLLTKDATTQTASATPNANDTATLNRPVRLVIPLEAASALAAAYAEQSTQDTLETGANAPVSDSAQSIQPELEVSINRDSQTNEITSIRITLPDGNIIEAEVINTDSEITPTSKTRINNTLLNEIFNNPDSEINPQSETVQNTPQTQPAEIKGLSRFLTALANRLFAQENTSAAATPAATAKLTLNDFILPLNLTLSNTGTISSELTVTLPFSADLQPLTTFLQENQELLLQSSATNNYTLSSTNPGSMPALLELPETNNIAIAEILDSLPAGQSGLTARLGSTVFLQGNLEELLSAETTTQNPPPTANLSRPQDDLSKLDALIRRSGMTPSMATRDAARALLDNAQPLTRSNIQALLALTAGKTGTERISLLQAGAKLISLDAPLSPPLASGFSSLSTSQDLFSSSLGRLNSALSQALSSSLESNLSQATTPETTPPANATGNLAPNLGRAIETIRGIPILIEALNTDETLTTTGSTTQSGNNQQLSDDLLNFVSTSARERLSTVEGLIQNATNEILRSDSVLSRLAPALDTILAKLSNLPEDSLQSSASSLEFSSAEKAIFERLNAKLLPDDTKSQPLNLSELLKDIPLLRERTSHPGINTIPEFWERVEIDRTTLDNSDIAKIKSGIEEILNSKNPEEAREISKELLKNIDRDTLRTLASTLQELEREEIQKHPTLQHLREASSELRELGRALIAQKAENLGNLRQDPANFSTSIPFSFNQNNNEQEDGKLSMHYNKSKGRKGEWQQRVILDLNMSALGNIIGDIQFYQGMININLISSQPDTVQILENDKTTLLLGLEGLGFTASVGVKLIQPKTSETNAEKQAQATSKHILDIQA